MPLVPLFRRTTGRLAPGRYDDRTLTGVRPKGSRRPHADERVEHVRRLIEDTQLSYGEISKRTGVGRASICRWTRDQGWRRHPFAPQATDKIPRARAGQKLKLRLLAERLRKLAERAIRELEDAPRVDIDRLMQALQVLKMARLEAMGRRRHRKFHGETRTGAQMIARDVAIRTALKEMNRGGVDIDNTPEEAIALVTDAYAPPDDHPALHRRGKKWR